MHNEPSTPTLTRSEPETLHDIPSTETSLIRLVVADDHPLFRQGIVRALEADGGFRVMGQAGDGAEALLMIRALEPDIALLDVRMPLLDGIDVVQALALHGPDVPIVLLSAFSDRQLVDSGLRAGAAAYIKKTYDRDAICLQLATIASNSAALAPRALSPRDPIKSPSGSWAPRIPVHEHELLQLAAAGLDKREIARRLALDEAAIRERATRLICRLDADSLDDAVARGRNLGLIR